MKVLQLRRSQFIVLSKLLFRNSAQNCHFLATKLTQAVILPRAICDSGDSHLSGVTTTPDYFLMLLEIFVETDTRLSPQ